jgi:hypothetical protein
MDNINPRWFIRQDQIEEGLVKFIFRERKFHHFTRVRLRRNPRFMLKNKEEEKEEEVNRAGKQEKPTIQVLDEEDSEDDETSLGGYNESEINYDLDYD